MVSHKHLGAVLMAVVLGIVEGAMGDSIANSLTTLHLKRGLASQMDTVSLRLRGGRNIECQNGAPAPWAGLNIGPKQRRLSRLRSKATPGKKVVCRWVIDCHIPVADRTLDVADLHNYLSQNIKVQAKTNNLGPTRTSKNPRVLLYVEPSNRIVVQAYIPLSKQYVKFLIKKYLEARGARDFIWCVATSKTAYQLRYYNFEDVRATAAAPSYGGGGGEDEDEEGEGEEGAQLTAAEEAEDAGEEEEEEAEEDGEDEAGEEEEEEEDEGGGEEPEDS